MYNLAERNNNQLQKNRIFQLCCCLHTTNSAHTLNYAFLALLELESGNQLVQWDCGSTGRIFKLGAMLTIVMLNDDLVQTLEYKVLV